jgi:hypothetical protein
MQQSRRLIAKGRAMAAQYRSTTSGVGDAAPLPEDLIESGKTLRVVLVDIKRDIETPDSFAIKFSLLTKTPLSKAKQMVRSLPVTVWSGTGRGKAERIVNLIDEAGGKGGIEIDAPPAPASVPESAPREMPACRYCGFPLKEGDSRCEFCRTSVSEAPAPEVHPVAAAPRARISKKRLLLYLCIIVAGIVVLLIQR